MHAAAASGDHGTLRHLLSLSPVETELKDLELGATPLIWASVCCQIATAELLLQSGANPNAVDGKGNTALYYALSGFANDLGVRTHDMGCSGRQVYRQLCLLLLRAASAV